MPATVFDKPIFPGAKQILCQLTVTNTSGSYTHTEQDERITSAMSANRIEIDDPSVFGAKISIVTANGSYTISCAEVSGETDIKISFLKVVDDQQFITSTEFDTLSNRIGDLDDLGTTDQTSMVNAVNEIVGNVSDNSQAIANLNTNMINSCEKKSVNGGTTITFNVTIGTVIFISRDAIGERSLYIVDQTGALIEMMSGTKSETISISNLVITITNNSGAAFLVTIIRPF